MTDDLVAKLRDEDSYYRLQEKHWCIDAEELERQRLAAAARIEALTAENERLASIVRGWHWLAVGPDEMGDYLHQRELIKASEPYASPALKSVPPAPPRKV